MVPTPWCLALSIIVYSTPFFLPLSTFVCGFWINFQGSQETCVWFYSFSFSAYLNALVMHIMYHRKFFYGLTRSYLGRCNIMHCLKLFLEKGSPSQLLFDRWLESNDKKRYGYCLTIMVPIVSGPLTLLTIGPLASSTPTMIIPTVGLNVRHKSVRPSQFATTTTTTTTTTVVVA